MKNLAVIIALIGSSAAVSRQHMLRSNNYLSLGDIYSNELANGDKSDDKELEKEDDGYDFIVDYNGGTNRGYGSSIPTTYMQNNHIMEGSHNTVPRMEGDQPLRNSPNYLQLDSEEVAEDQLLSQLSSTLVSAQRSEAKGDGDAAVAKTAAIKNIQKSLTARILKRLDDGQPLVEVARKMKAIEGMQPQINDMERRLGIMQSVEPVLENAIKTLQKVVDVRGMGKK